MNWMDHAMCVQHCERARGREKKNQPNFYNIILINVEKVGAAHIQLCSERKWVWTNEYVCSLLCDWIHMFMDKQEIFILYSVIQWKSALILDGNSSDGNMTFGGRKKLLLFVQCSAKLFADEMRKQEW